MTRDQTGYEHDPLSTRQHYADDTVCTGCGAVARSQRWTLDAPRAEMLLATGASEQALCPACLKSEERLPGGILTLRGDYWPRHRDDILNLIRNQEEEARQDNPLERILSLREENGSVIVETTNEKLAQKIGRSIAKAHHGHIEYQWGDGNRLVRVNWERRL
ncbi:MAG: BCAM0308 family protein [Actinomycetota bacterium]